MKKTGKILSSILCIAALTSAFAFTACGDGTPNDGTHTDDPITAENIVKDEESWNKAFENFDYSNISCNLIGTNNYGMQSEIKVKISEKVVYYMSKIGDDTKTDEMGHRGHYEEYYSVKNDDGLYTTYVKWGSQAEFVLNGSGPEMFENAKNEITLKVEYMDCFNDFVYDANSGTYTCDKEVIAKHRQQMSGGYDDTYLLYCTNNVVKMQNGKVSSVKCNANKMSCECHCDSSAGNKNDHNETIEVNVTVEYYDIGTTSFEVPPEVIAEANKPFIDLD